MKLLLKILFTIIIAMLVLYGAAHVFIMLKGKALLVRKLEEFSHKKVSVDYLNVLPPLNLEISNLNIEGLATVERLSISPSILYLLTGNIALNKIVIVKPQVTYQRIPVAKPELSTAQPPEEAVVATPVSTPAAMPVIKEERRPFRLTIKRLKIKEGKINFIDKAIASEALKITVKDINFNLSNLHLFPFSGITNFELEGKIPWRQGKEEGKISAEGWLNFLKKDMQATLKIEDIDGVYLYPYYSNWVDLEKARIESAKLNFTGNIHGLNNNVTAECRLELTDIVRKPRSPDEPQEKAERIADAVLDIFKALNQGKIVLDFTIRTRMDRPEFGFGDIRMAFEDKLTRGRKTDKSSIETVLSLPAKLLEGTVKGATDVSKAVIDGTFAVGNELKEAVEGAFKKEKINPDESR